MRQQTIAVCISGQIRTPISELHKTAEEARLCGADVFISVWDEIGQKTFEGAVGPKNIRRIVGNEIAQLLPDNWLGRMKDIFPQFRSFFPKQPNVTESALRAIFGEADIDVERDSHEYDLATNDSNSRRMLYKIWRANQMKNRREAERGEKYDLVLRIRPDMLFSGDALRSLQATEGTVYVQGHVQSRKDYINDTIWAATSKDDDSLCQTYNRLEGCDVLQWRGIHRELAAVAQAAGIHTRLIPVIKAGAGGLKTEDEKYTNLVGENLCHAITTKQVVVSKAGGDVYCDLVRHVLLARNSASRNVAPSQAIFSSSDLSKIFESLPRRGGNYFGALIYVLNICYYDTYLPVNDRIYFMFMFLAHYLSVGAQVHFDVRVEEIAANFGSQADSLLHVLVDNKPDLPQPIHPTSIELQGRLAAILDKTKALDSPDIITNVKSTILGSSVFLQTQFAAFLQMEQFDNAYALAKASAAISPKNWRAYEFMAHSAEKMGNHDLVEAAFVLGGKNLPPHARLLELKGNYYVRAGEYQLAKAAYEQALSLPDSNTTRIATALEVIQKHSR